MRQVNPRRTTAGAVLVAAMALASACGHTAVEEVQTEAAPAVKVQAIQPKTFEGVVAASGVVAAAPGADWTITAPEPARIAEIAKAEGDRVKTGDLLVRFEIPSLSTDVAQRRSEVQQAEAHVANAQA